MSDLTNSKLLVNLTERAKCLVVNSVMPTTRTSYGSDWKQFAAFCDENNLSNPSVVTDEAPNHVTCFITTTFDGNNTAGTCHNIRSAIRSHYNYTIKTPDGWRNCNVLHKFTGNPCNAIEVTEITKGMHNTSRNR